MLASDAVLCRLTEARKNGECSWMRPDGKTQVTVEYKNDGGAMVPQRVHTILISTQHAPDISNEKLREDLMEKVIKPVVPAKYIDDKTIFHLNPSGSFCTGGPFSDAGLTGRKIIIDTYGGWGAHGGGAFSGKDPTKVDRSGAYITRQAAKSIVAAGLARRALVQVCNALIMLYMHGAAIMAYIFALWWCMIVWIVSVLLSSTKTCAGILLHWHSRAIVCIC